MKKHFTLSVPGPCSEDWDAMQPQGCGRFCSACEKTVVDFTRFSDQEFIRYFQQAKTIPCGRFTQRQFSIVIPPENNSPAFFPNWNKYLAAGIITITGSAINTHAQTPDTAGQYIQIPTTADTAVKEQTTITTLKDSTALSNTDQLKDVNIYGTKVNIIRRYSRANVIMAGTPRVNIVKSLEGMPPGITAPPGISKPAKPSLWRRLTRPFRKKS